MEIVFPLEFLVSGVPVSHQAKRAESREQWKQRVIGASRSALPKPHFASTDAIAVTLFYFPADRMQGDVDNVVKLVLDACSRHIYLDDAQVERVVVHKFEPDRLFAFMSPTPTLAKALRGHKPLLYIKVSNDPYKDLR